MIEVSWSGCIPVCLGGCWWWWYNDNDDGVDDDDDAMRNEKEDDTRSDQDQLYWPAETRAEW